MISLAWQYWKKKPTFFKINWFFTVQLCKSIGNSSRHYIRQDFNQGLLNLPYEILMNLLMVVILSISWRMASRNDHPELAFPHFDFPSPALSVLFCSGPFYRPQFCDEKAAVTIWTFHWGGCSPRANQICESFWPCLLLNLPKPSGRITLEVTEDFLCFAVHCTFHVCSVGFSWQV